MTNWLAASDANNAELLAAFVGVTLLSGTVGLVFDVKKTKMAIYRTHKRPSWAPPAPLIGLIWTAVYTFCGTAAYLVRRDGGAYTHATAHPLAHYALFLLVLAFYSPGSKHPGRALAIVVTAFLIGLAVCYNFTQVSSLAGVMVASMLMWLFVMILLSVAILSRAMHDRVYAAAANQSSAGKSHKNRHLKTGKTSSHNEVDTC